MLGIMRTAFLALFLVLAALGSFALASRCAPIPQEEPVRGSHGFRIWSGGSLRSFTQEGGRICVPPGWEAVGSVAEGDGWARFGAGETGVVIRTDAFVSREMSVPGSSYALTLRYPASADAAEAASYEAVVRRSFDEVGALFLDAGKKPRPHTVLVTAGIPFFSHEDASVYPDPGPEVSYLILDPSWPRSEELFTHAVYHLYNRHRPDLIAYQENQAPISAHDWQEAEAAWSETALSTSAENRADRLAYLLSVHEAVRSRDFARITMPPFDDEILFRQMHGALATDSESSYLDVQYAHYVLAPLMMVAIEGLLGTAGSATTVADLLRETHADPAVNFFERLATLLPEEDMERVIRFATGAETIPRELIFRGADRYEL